MTIKMHGTTILAVKRDNAVTIGGDGQVTLGNMVVKGTANKIRRLYKDQVIAGFAGSTADAFTLFEKFESKLQEHQGNLKLAAVRLATDWRSDRMLHKLEAMLLVADPQNIYAISGMGDVLEPEHNLMAIGSGGGFASASARALYENSTLTSEDIVRKSLNIAGDICIYTNNNLTIDTLIKQSND